MDTSVFSLEHFNVLEDEQYYYVFRALNRADHNDVISGKTISSGKIARIRTDRERWVEDNDSSRYSEDSEISLEEVWNHIKMHYSKETNCISLSSNANVSLDYGNGYFDEYAVVKVPKNGSSSIYPAGQYMLEEIKKKIDSVISQGNLSDEVTSLLERISREQDYNRIVQLVNQYQKDLSNTKDISSRFQNKQYFSPKQQLEYNRIVAEATVLELSGDLPSILDSTSDNRSLLATVGNAFSSMEVIHYQDIDVDKEGTVFLSRPMMGLVGVVQQLKELHPGQGVEELEKNLLYFINHHFDLRDVDGKIVLTNGQYSIDCHLNTSDTTILERKSLDEALLSVHDIYDMTGGSISYNKAKEAVEFSYYLALARKEAYEYANVLEAISSSSIFNDAVCNETFSVNNKIICRNNSGGFKISESVNVGLSGASYSQNEQLRFLALIQRLGYNDLEEIVNNSGLSIRDAVFSLLQKERKVMDRNRYYAQSIVDSLDYSSIYRNAVFREDFIDEEREKLVEDLASVNISRLYDSFLKLNLSHTDISNYIINFMIESSYKGYSFRDLCDLDDLDSFLLDNLDKLNKTINPYTLNRYFGIYDTENFIPGTNLNLRDYQLRIKNDVDRIYNDGRRFAGVVLPTGGGKSFIAMAEMLERKDSNIVYIAPRREILNQFKRHIVKYVAGVDSTNLTSQQQDEVVKSYFPHLELYCYQGLDKDDEEKLKKYDADFIILDELHHVGADSWNPAIKSLFSRNPNSKVLGITATPVRDDVRPNDPYSGDMMRAMADLLDDYTQEELNHKLYLASNMNIVEAIQEGYVICPNIVSFDYYLENSRTYQDTLKTLSKMRDSALRRTLNDKLGQLQEVIRDAKIVGEDHIYQQYIRDASGRYILFLPRKPLSLDISTEEYIQEQIEEFKKNLHLIDSDPHVEYIYSAKGNKENAAAMQRFESDDSSHIKILAAIDMLNEGVHLERLKGSFNYRQIDSNHPILAQQHLGRVIYSLVPGEVVRPEDVPVVFDKYNNYFNMDFDRIVNRTSVSSDLEKMKDMMFYIQKHGYIPQTDSINRSEQRKALTLRRLQLKYQKFLGKDLSDFRFNAEEAYEVSEIMRMGKEIDLWNFEFQKVSREVQEELGRVNIFSATAVQQSFLDICHDIQKVAGIEKLSDRNRLDNVFRVLDYLSEYQIELGPKTIRDDMKLGEFLRPLDITIQEDIMYELNKYGIDQDYLLGPEFYFARSLFARGNKYFNNLDSYKEAVSHLRNCGILENDDDYTFVNQDGFIVLGPQPYHYLNIWTGTHYSEAGYDYRGLNEDLFDSSGIHFYTNTFYNRDGFDCHHIHRFTHTKYDPHGFDIHRIHKDTNDIIDPRHFDSYGFYHKYDYASGEYTLTSTKYDSEGYDIDGYDRLGFNKEGIHKDTHMPYNLWHFDKDGFYWKKTENGRIKTDSKLDERGYNRKGELFIKDESTGELINRGQVYDSHGFYFDGTHYLTGTLYDERGFDREGFWHDKDYDGNYQEVSYSKFNRQGWNIDHMTVRHTAMGKPFLDYVDDHGFDEKKRYHRPTVPTDKDGFIDFQGGTVYYSKNNTYQTFDIHGFDYRGIHKLTNGPLDPQGFDIDGFWHKQFDDGTDINTGQYFNPDGWTIDKRRFDDFGHYVKRDCYGFDAFGYCLLDRHKSRYDSHGFDCHGIHNETGTTIDLEHFDRDGYWYTEDENGTFISTGQKYNPEGWNHDHVFKSTGHIVDEHGFDYLHFYHKKNLELSLYDSHGFDYRGIHKTTGTNLNGNQFDIDGYYYEKIGDQFVKTDSKYDPNGLNIDRLDERGFSANGFYNGKRRRVDENGFDVNGFHFLTHQPYDLDGIDCYGKKSPDFDRGLVEKLKERISFDKRRYLSDLYADLSHDDRDSILDAYDVVMDELDTENDFLVSFVDYAKSYGILSDESLPEDEDVYDFVTRRAIHRYENDYARELEDVAQVYYVRGIEEGDVHWADTSQAYSSSDLVRDGHIIHGHKL